MHISTMKAGESSAPSLDTPLEVPEMFSSPEPFDVVAFADFLLTSLLRHDSDVLHAQFRDGLGSWCVRPHPDGEDVEIGQQDSVGYFRMVLARFAYYYMAVQLYGGSAQRVLIQRGRRYDCDISMSNDNRMGYWLRVYARVNAA